MDRPLMQQVLDSMLMHIAVLDRDGRILLVNRAWSRFANANGVCSDRSVGAGANYLHVCQPGIEQDVEGANLAHSGIRSVLTGSCQEFRLEYPCHSEADERWFLMSATPLHDASAAAVISHLDITSRKLAERRLEHLAHHDELTSLANRRLFLDMGTKSVAASRRHDRPISVVYIDVDRFKQINDSLGHDAGDYVLSVVAKRLKTSVRENDVACRLGGDEFAILVDGGPDDAAAMMARLREAIAAPLDFKGQSIFVSASMGAASLRDPNDTFDTLVKLADESMYEEKRSSKDRRARTGQDAV